VAGTYSYCSTREIIALQVKWPVRATLAHATAAAAAAACDVAGQSWSVVVSVMVSLAQCRWSVVVSRGQSWSVSWSVWRSDDGHVRQAALLLVTASCAEPSPSEQATCVQSCPARPICRGNAAAGHDTHSCSPLLEETGGSCDGA